MFDHSVKVPRLYKLASKVAKDVNIGKGSIKQLVYECKHPNIKALYALVVHTFQRTEDLDKLLKKSKILIKEPRLDPWLAKILITELLWGKKSLSGQSKPIQTILAYEQIFKAHLSDIETHLEEPQQVDKPRYVRVNTLKISVNEAVVGFRDEGWILKRYLDSDNYLGFLDAVANLGSEEFMIDIHIPYLLIFPPKTQFYKHPAYKNGSIILQDKASCLPVHILNPEKGSIILDMCAAPGMKTTQTAAVIQNDGLIYATEIKTKRFQTLTKIVESSGATCVKTINRDVTTITNKDCPNIEYILVDPSCSGSGITDRVEIGQQKPAQDPSRLEKLAAFQITILRYALKFPKAKRVVYSTCSMFPEENEDVVRQVLESCTNFKLVPASQFVNNLWINYGSSVFGDIGNYCLYAKPDIDLTSGFFVAVFERLQEGETNQFLNVNLFPKQKTYKRKGNDLKSTLDEVIDQENIESDKLSLSRSDKIEEGFESHKKKKKKNKDLQDTDLELSQIKNEHLEDFLSTKCDKFSLTSVKTEEDFDSPKKKKKKYTDLQNTDLELFQIKNEHLEDFLSIKGNKSSLTSVKTEEDFESHKKKKKKSKDLQNTDLELPQNKNEHLEDFLNTKGNKLSLTSVKIEDYESHKKKKKKTQDLQNTDLELSQNKNEHVEDFLSTKGNKSSITSVKTEEDVESPKKKKKKYTDLQNTDLELFQIKNEHLVDFLSIKGNKSSLTSVKTEEDFESHKKKKKKCKDLQNTDLELSQNKNEQLEEYLITMKEHKNKNKEKQILADCDDTNEKQAEINDSECQVAKKKKKKEKNDIDEHDDMSKQQLNVGIIDVSLGKKKKEEEHIRNIDSEDTYETETDLIKAKKKKKVEQENDSNKEICQESTKTKKKKKHRRV